MKLLISFLLAIFLFSVSGKSQFAEDVFVKGIDGKDVNLKNIEITKDTVMIYVWCKTCGICIANLDNYKRWNLEKNYQIITIAISKSDSIETEKKIIEKHKWTYQLYYDNYYIQNLTKFFIKKGYYKMPNNSEKEVERFAYYPQVFIFVKGQLICSEFKNCNQYLYPE